MSTLLKKNMRISLDAVNFTQQLVGEDLPYYGVLSYTCQNQSFIIPHFQTKSYREKPSHK